MTFADTDNSTSVDIGIDLAFLENVEPEPEKVSAPVFTSIDDIVRAIAVEVVDEAIAAIPEPEVPEVPEFEFDIQDYAYEIRDIAEYAVSDSMQGFNPSEWGYMSPSDFISAQDYDPDEWVTNDVFNTFREEVGEVVNDLKSGNGNDNSDLESRIESIESRLENIEEALHHLVLGCTHLK